MFFILKHLYPYTLIIYNLLLPPPLSYVKEIFSANHVAWYRENNIVFLGRGGQKYFCTTL